MKVFQQEDKAASPTFSLLSEIREEADIQQSPTDYHLLSSGFPPAPHGIQPARSHIYQSPISCLDAQYAESAQLRGHIIVCTPNFDMWTFVATMR